MRVLVVEDDLVLSKQLTDELALAGYVVESATNGIDGEYLGEVEVYDAVVLDLGLPQMDGITVLKKWRAAGCTMPVLILTARNAWHEKSRVSMPVLTTTWPSPFTWKSCSPGCAH